MNEQEAIKHLREDILPNLDAGRKIKATSVTTEANKRAAKDAYFEVFQLANMLEQGRKVAAADKLGYIVSEHYWVADDIAEELFDLVYSFQTRI